MVREAKARGLKSHGGGLSTPFHPHGGSDRGYNTHAKMNPHCGRARTCRRLKMDCVTARST